MSWFRFGVGCPSCETPLEPVALGRPTDIGTRTANVLRCDPCNTEWLLELGLTRAHHSIDPTAKTGKPMSCAEWVRGLIAEGPVTTAQAVERAGGTWQHHAIAAAMRRAVAAGDAVREKNHDGVYVYRGV